MNKKSYSRYRKSRNWRTKRRTIMKRAGYKCRKCGRRATQVHHETYKRVGRERLSDLTAMCGGCHKRIHGKWQLPYRANGHFIDLLLLLAFYDIINLINSCN